MKAAISASLSAVAAGAMLGACASKAPETVGTAGEDPTAAEYQQLVDNASQRLVCKREAVLGTRVANVVCVSEAEMKAQREHAADVMRDIRANTPINPHGTPPPAPPPSPQPR